MITFRNIILISAMAVLLFTLGCSSRHSAGQENAVYKNWGRSFESIKYSQVLYPEAGGVQPVEGFDGPNAEYLYQQYQNMFSGEAESFQSITGSVK